MNAVVLILSIINFLVAIALLAIVLLRTRPGSAGQGIVTGTGAQALGPELRQEFGALRGELSQSLAVGQQQLDTRLQTVTSMQADDLARDRDARSSAQLEQRELLERSLAGLHDRLHASAQAGVQSQTEFTGTVEARFEALRLANDAQLELVRATVGEKLQDTLKVSLDENAKRVQALTDTHVSKQTELQETLRQEIEKLQVTQREELDKLRATLRTELEQLRQGNEAKLEKMRETVDEKLQGTLERRLGESFKLVSDRLEQVQKGLGEMQTLASDVGGLKRVLTNVKSRGSWGEVQLARQLEDMLTPEQYAENVAVEPGSADRVEFAVKLPGREEGEVPVWLPIDSKFPQEDYERLLEAQEGGEKDAVDAAGRVVEKVIIAQAKLISEKYIHPPHTTDFAIMYLPTEGLFAEAIRRPGLASKLQNDFHVTIAGPTVLMALLNSLQLGFRTLAIEKRSSEVWKVLGAAKAEFKKYGQVWDKLEKQLQTAQNTVQLAGVRTRAVERTLRSVETLEVPSVVAEDSPAALEAAVARLSADESPMNTFDEVFDAQQ
ncbi:DNA recombination protein RmuC [Leucobacter exalbidus]|uniref:DNA recombination protein RmuC n=1 Tax=Leucobacter exalbidus TaxID=662960 RepID=A0A940T3H1_9MICO|nr:DNA recombination protein RmuC [Leucobacter exalbidus]MBP1325739.1 DNA recombination protein RmuC [Leucobacter exalbidus]